MRELTDFGEGSDKKPESNHVHLVHIIPFPREQLQISDESERTRPGDLLDIVYMTHGIIRPFAVQILCIYRPGRLVFALFTLQKKRGESLWKKQEYCGGIPIE